MAAYDELLEQIAITNVVDADWRILRDMLKHKLAENINAYLTLGPPWPLSPEDAFKARGGAYDALDQFTGPPFTIQRICELILYPRKHYTSLPKYLRALMRVLSVASTRSAFNEDETFVEPFASTSATTLDGAAIVNPHQIRASASPLPSPTMPTRRPSVPRSPSSSPRALPVVVPLLSPIPWLIKTSDDGDGNESVEEMDLSNTSAGHVFHSSSSPSRSSDGGRSPIRGLEMARRSHSPPSPSQLNNNSGLIHSGNHTTPTGGVVDEVDPGSGGSEVVDPVALSSATEIAPKPADSLLGVHGSSQSLRERFVRASSPRADPPEERTEEGER
ncbi:BQ2448_5477 [Microbotryum intermedium]|uniref:BQ2448_5477 protein n=1 Tax=Microbotryum intermedium TaxID=269621 RepID=A0A238F9V5_9BASI|nr:BQ2448_5477 [Microbotryum intermedium]